MKSLVEIEERWSLEDALDAHIALDVWDDLERASNRAMTER